MNIAGLRRVALLSVFAASAAEATMQRTFVASNGSDAGPCSVTQPCRSFAAALLQTNSGGEIIVLSSAGYGTVTIAKSVTIRSPQGVYAGISVLAGGDGITIDDGGTNMIVVVLANLVVNGQGGFTGINIAHASEVFIESCTIANMSAAGIYQAAGVMHVTDTASRNNGAEGIRVDGHRASIVRSRLEGNASHGLNANNGATVSVQDSVLARSATGLLVHTGIAATITQVTVARSLISQNVSGLGAFTTVGGAVARVEVTDSLVTDNSYGAFADQIGGGAPTLAAVRTTFARNGLGVRLPSAGTTAVLDSNHFSNNGNAVATVAGSTVYSRGNNVLAGDTNAVGGTTAAAATY